MRLFNKVAIVLALLSGSGVSLHADDNAYFKVGPLELNIPFKSARVTYLYDFKAKQSLVGGETPLATLWNRLEGTAGVVTSLDGAGTPFLGGNVIVGNVLERYVALPPDFLLGGFGGFNFRTEQPIFGLKASLKVW